MDERFFGKVCKKLEEHLCFLLFQKRYFFGRIEIIKEPQVLQRKQCKFLLFKSENVLRSFWRDVKNRRKNTGWPVVVFKPQWHRQTWVIQGANDSAHDFIRQGQNQEKKKTATIKLKHFLWNFFRQKKKKDTRWVHDFPPMLLNLLPWNLEALWVIPEVFSLQPLQLLS